MRSVTATQMPENISEVVCIKPPPLVSSLRGIAAMASLLSRRRNACVSEHFTLNKSRISSANRLMQLQFVKCANQGPAAQMCHESFVQDLRRLAREDQFSSELEWVIRDLSEAPPWLEDGLR
jgi:hypothetical protein